VICHPFAEESIIARRVVTNLARKLALEGFPCLRFDYMGEGDSDGWFEDSTVVSRLSDIAGAVTYARENLDAVRIGLVGIRFGATLAAAACNSIGGIDPLILIAPITAGRPYLGQLLRANLAFQMAAYRRIVKDREALLADLENGKSINVDGYLLTNRLYGEMDEMQLQTIQFGSPPRMLVLDINRSDKQPAKKDIVRICEHYQSQGIQVDLETVADQFFWTDGRKHFPHAVNVEDELASWLYRNYR
jgi:hypothetical protein